MTNVDHQSLFRRCGIDAEPAQHASSDQAPKPAADAEPDATFEPTTLAMQRLQRWMQTREAIAEPGFDRRRAAQACSALACSAGTSWSVP